MVNQWRSGPARLTLWVYLAVHAFLWGVFVTLMITLVPRYGKLFDTYGLALSRFTTLVRTVSRWLLDYWYAAALFAAIALTVDGVVLFRLRVKPHTRRLIHPLGLAAIVLLIFASLLVGWSIMLPWVKLQKGLAR